MTHSRYLSTRRIELPSNSTNYHQGEVSDYTPGFLDYKRTNKSWLFDNTILHTKRKLCRRLCESLFRQLHR